MRHPPPRERRVRVGPVVCVPIGVHSVLLLSETVVDDILVGGEDLDAVARALVDAPLDPIDEIGWGLCPRLSIAKGYP